MIFFSDVTVTFSQYKSVCVRRQRRGGRSIAVSVSTYHCLGASQRIAMPWGEQKQRTETSLTHRAHTAQIHTEH